MSDMSEWRTILGKAVRERRQAFELTLDEASRVIGISRSHLNLIELGKATGISRECAERIDANLDFNGELLALLPTARPSTPISSEPVRRAEFNKAVLALAATVLLDPDRLNARQDLQPRLARVTATTAVIAGWVVFRGHGDLMTAHAQLALGRDHARTAG